MSITHEINPGEGFILFTPTKSFATEDLVATWKEIFTNPLFRKGMDAVWKLGPGTMDKINRATLDEICRATVEMIDERGRGKAALAAPADFEYGMSRMCEIICETAVPFDLGAFRSLDQALSWIRTRETATG